MPILNIQEEIKHLIMPSSVNKPAEEQFWVELDVAPLIGADYELVGFGFTNTQVMVTILTRRIKVWNFADTNGVVLEINKDNILKLTFADIAWLRQSIKEAEGLPEPLSTPEKKDSTPGSSPSDAVSQ